MIQLLLIGCYYESSQRWQDVQRYTEAQSQIQVHDSVSTCLQIENETLRGECIWFAAQLAIQQGVGSFVRDQVRQDIVEKRVQTLRALRERQLHMIDTAR